MQAPAGERELPSNGSPPVVDDASVQDRLGFDKASKTLNWLLAQSKPPIDCLVDAADQVAVVTGGRPTLVKGREQGSNSSTCCLTDSR
uniref:TCP domain-containing protein n=1 Tax=Zea mays TaxID=4577 RepID=A0A804RFB9_MAIZE